MWLERFLPTALSIRHLSFLDLGCSHPLELQGCRRHCQGRGLGRGGQRPPEKGRRGRRRRWRPSIGPQNSLQPGLFCCRNSFWGIWHFPANFCITKGQLWPSSKSQTKFLAVVDKDYSNTQKTVKECPLRVKIMIADCLIQQKIAFSPKINTKFHNLKTKHVNSYL